MQDDLPLPPSPVWPALTTAELVGRKPDAAAFGQLPRAPISVVLDDVRSVAVAVLVDGHADVRRGATSTALGELDAVVARGERFEITTASRAVVALVRIDEA